TGRGTRRRRCRHRAGVLLPRRGKRRLVGVSAPARRRGARRCLVADWSHVREGFRDSRSADKRRFGVREPTGMSGDAVLGIDAGGSSTRWLLLSGDGETIASGQVGPVSGIDLGNPDAAAAGSPTVLDNLAELAA